MNSLHELADSATDPALREAIDAALAAAVVERMSRDELAKQLAKRVSARQAREMAALYGPVAPHSRQTTATVVISSSVAVAIVRSLLEQNGQGRRSAIGEA